MTVRAVMNPNVATIDSNEDVLRAAILMREEHVGDLIVTEQRDGRTQPIGVITDRDIVVGVIAESVQPTDVKVGDAIQRELLTIREDNGIAYALGEMRRAGVRRMPVIDNRDRLVGVLAIDDIIDHLASQLSDIAGAIRTESELESKQRP